MITVGYAYLGLSVCFSIQCFFLWFVKNSVFFDEHQILRYNIVHRLWPYANSIIFWSIPEILKGIVKGQIYWQTFWGHHLAISINHILVVCVCICFFKKNLGLLKKIVWNLKSFYKECADDRKRACMWEEREQHVWWTNTALYCHYVIIFIRMQQVHASEIQYN